MLGLPGYGAVLQGQADHDDELRLLGRQARQPASTAPASRCRRSSSRQLTNFLYDDGRAPRPATRPGGDGRRSARSRPGATTSSCWRWSRTPTTVRSSRSRRRAAATVQPNGGPVGDRARSTTRSPSSLCASASGRRGDALGRRAARARAFPEADRDARAPTRRTRSAAAGWPTSPASGSSTTAARSSATRGSSASTRSAIPTASASIPSLTIAAVCERAAARLVDRAADHGLPVAPAGFRSGTPPRVG